MQAAGPVVDLVPIVGGTIFRTGVSTAVVAEHAHPELQLSVRLAGAGSGHVAFTDSHEPHGGLTLAGEILLFYYEPEYIARLAWDAFGLASTAFDQRGIHDDHFVRAVAGEVEAAMPMLREHVFAESAASLIAGHLIRCYATEKRARWRGGRGLSPKQIALVTARMNEHGAPPPSLDELAALLDMSPFRFLRLFTATTGATPRQYLITRRLEDAAVRLRQSGDSIAAIAAACGFAHQSHFGQQFRRRFGVTPSQFREKG